ncbi:lysis protein [Lactiplantibacillus plantarum]|uniref:holin n=2 Tax=Lactiplantibacillus plantarum TaxID=1590 RepID=UPI0013DFD87D|nr:holin [Lactiplantibacillus plantarum]MDI5785607.1 lysis protein [Lactiplantibacillus plantarum]NGM27158.1 lysis protein [Lactiplantibacillus plantarum]
MMELIQFINGTTIAAIAVVTYLVVWAIKQSKLSNQYLPIVAILIGAVIGISIGIANGDIKWVAGLVDGVIAGAVSVGGNELAKSIGTMFNGGAK